MGSIQEDKIALGLLGLGEEAPEEDEADGDLQVRAASYLAPACLLLLGLLSAVGGYVNGVIFFIFPFCFFGHFLPSVHT